MRLIPTFALVTLLASTAAHAAWHPGGVLIGDVGGEVVAIRSGANVVVAWTRQVAFQVFEIRAQAWTGEGEIAPGWPADGVLVNSASSTSRWLRICEDGEGGSFVAWTSYGTDDSYLQRVSATGVAPGWPANGRPFVAGTEGAHVAATSLAPDGAGGVVVGCIESRFDGGAYSVGARVHRVDAGGASPAGWPPGGLGIPDARDVGVMASGSRVFVSTANLYQDGGIRLWRLGLDATPDPGWPVTIPDTRYAAELRLLPDGAGGVFAGWGSVLVCVGIGSPCPPPLLSTTRILADGTQDSGWSPVPMAYSIAPDGAGGLLMGVGTHRRPGVLRLDAAGAPPSGWESSGNPAMTEVVYLQSVQVADDGAGGAFAAWIDSRSGQDRLYASRLDSRGRLAAGWPPTGTLVNGEGTQGVSLAGLVSLGGGVAIAVWSEWTPQGWKGHLSALRPGEPGPIADLRPVAEEVGFGIVHLRTNPTHGPIVALVELPNEGAARVDLLDAAGRVVESQDFAFSSRSRGAVRFNQAGQHPPGVYWVRVAQGARRSIKKAVLIE